MLPYAFVAIIEIYSESKCSNRMIFCVQLRESDLNCVSANTILYKSEHLIDLLNILFHFCALNELKYVTQSRNLPYYGPHMEHRTCEM